MIINNLKCIENVKDEVLREEIEVQLGYIISSIESYGETFIPDKHGKILVLNTKEDILDNPIEYESYSSNDSVYGTNYSKRIFLSNDSGCDVLIVYIHNNLLVYI